MDCLQSCHSRSSIGLSATKIKGMTWQHADEVRKLSYGRGKACNGFGAIVNRHVHVMRSKAV